MNLAKKTIMTLLVLGLSFSASGNLFAHEGNDDAAFVKVLQDSAAALKSSQPALATDLTSWATEEANEKEGKEEAKEKNTPERMALRETHLKLLRDSAAALQATHPELASKLTKRANGNEKRMKKK